MLMYYYSQGPLVCVRSMLQATAPRRLTSEVRSNQLSETEDGGNEWKAAGPDDAGKKVEGLNPVPANTFLRKKYDYLLVFMSNLNNYSSEIGIVQKYLFTYK